MTDPVEAVPAAAAAEPAPRFGRFFWRDPNTQFLLLAALAGVLGAAGAIVFRQLSHLLTRLLLAADNPVEGAAALPAALRIFVPAAGALLGGLLARRFVTEGGTTGISQVIEVVSLGRRTVRIRPTLGRAAASLAVISSGGSEGREGPIVQLGSALASWLGRQLRVSPERVRILAACGMAAGVAGAYNTPIAATLFVLEVVVGSFSMTLFGPAVVSAVVSTVTVRFFLGDQPVYDVAPFNLASISEFLPFAVIGLAGGAVSALFVQALRRARTMFQSLALPGPAAMAVGGGLVGAIGIVLPGVWGNGFEATDAILANRVTVLALALLFVGKILATCATIGSGGTGGVFTPSLLIGAALGGLVAKGTQALLPAIEAPVGGYALLGMGSLLAGVTRAPLLALIMIFELTQNSAVLLPMMVVSVTAVLVARAFEKDSIYIQALRSAGIAWERTPEATAMTSLRVREIMREDVKLVPRTMTLPQILDTFLRTRSLYLYVGDEEGRLLGVVDLHDVKEAMTEKEVNALVIAEDVVSEIPFVTPEEPLTSVNEKLWFRDLGQLPVVDPASGRFLGIVTRRDVLGAFDREVLQRNRLVARVRGFGQEEFDYFELPEKHRLVEVDVPPELVGKTVAEAGLRSRWGVSVLAVKRVSRKGIQRRFVPGPTDRLERGDVLILLGSDEAIAAVQGRSSPPVLS